MKKKYSLEYVLVLLFRYQVYLIKHNIKHPQIYFLFIHTQIEKVPGNILEIIIYNQLSYNIILIIPNNKYVFNLLYLLFEQ